MFTCAGRDRFAACRAYIKYRKTQVPLTMTYKADQVQLVFSVVLKRQGGDFILYRASGAPELAVREYARIFVGVWLG
eukprot:44742-Eustigmatos_ZCMA.PRE.1